LPEPETEIPTDQQPPASRGSQMMASVGNEETVAPQIAPTSVGMPEVIRALRHHDFRLFWFGNFLSNIGTWMQNVAQGWLVLTLVPRGKAAFWLGVIGFAASAPMLVFTLIGGVIADRVDKRKLMLVTQSSMMLFAFLMWGLTATHRINLEMIVLLAFLTGLAMSLNTPSYQSMVPQLVPPEDLTNAIALNSAQFNMSRVLGPTLGGLAMAWFGISGNFLLNALSFGAVLIALTRITYPGRYAGNGNASLWETMAEGFRYILERKEMFYLLVITAIASVLAIPYITFIPLFAKEILHTQERGFGLLMASSGAGAFLGAATVAYVKQLKCRGRFVVRAALAFYAGIILFSFSRNFALSLFLLAAIGYCMILMIANVNALLQQLSANEMRGRVMSIYATAFLGFAPIGTLFAGSLAGTIGAPEAIALMSAVAFVATLAIYRWRGELRSLN